MRNRENSKMEMIISKYPIHKKHVVCLSTLLSTLFFSPSFFLLLPRESLLHFLISLTYSVLTSSPSAATSNFLSDRLFSFYFFSNDFYLSNKCISNPPSFKKLWSQCTVGRFLYTAKWVLSSPNLLIPEIKTHYLISSHIF